MTAPLPSQPRRWLVLGYGNTLRGDDAAGPLLAERVAARGWPGVLARAATQLTPELAALLTDFDAVVFADAREGGDAVTLTPLAPANAAAAAALGHRSDPAGLLALADALFGARPAAWLLTMPGHDFTPGAELSAATRAALQAAEHRLARLMGREGEL